MKFVSLLMVVLLSLGLLAGCGENKREEITVENGCFSVTPQEFVEQINKEISFLKESDEKANTLMLLPEYSESGKEETVGTKTYITYTANDDGKMTSLKFKWYLFGSSEEDAMFMGFLISSLPSMFRPDSEVDLVAEFPSISSLDTEFDGVTDGDIYYDLITHKGLGEITVMPRG